MSARGRTGVLGLAPRASRPVRLGVLVALAAVCGLLAPGPAAAQQVTLRTGDHPTFARLVLAIPPGADWSLEPAPGGVAVRVPGASFDLAGAFDRIGRDRVADLADAGDGRLLVTVACPCGASAFLFRPDRLVVDVADGPAQPGAVAPGPAEPPAEASPASTLVADGPAAPEAEAAILEGLARAASQGFLDVAPGPGTLPDLDPPRPPEPAPAPDPLPTRAPPAAGPGVAFRGAGDQGAPAPPVGATGSTCLGDDRLDLAAWAGDGEADTDGDGDDWAAVMPARIAALVDNRDRPDPEAVEELARAYVAFGFGREAAQALRLDGAASAERDLLLLLARLVDGDPVDPTAFDDQRGCLGAVALWRALARGTLEDTSERERTAALVALRALPDAVRGHLGLRLATLLLDAGDADGARALADIAARADTGGGTQAGLARAAIAGAAEGPDAQIARLTALARGDARITAEAMANLLRLSVAEGRLVPPDLLALARALRFEADGTDAARDLLLAEMAALADAGRFADAFALGVENRDAGGDVDAALAEAAALMAERVPDGDFLALALDALPPDLPASAANRVARRFLDLGFPPEARALLVGPASGEALGERRRLQAEAALALGDARGVESALLGLDDPRAEELRARAAGLRPPPAPVAGTEATPELAAPPDTLAARRALLDEAGEARARASALLEAGG